MNKKTQYLLTGSGAMMVILILAAPTLVRIIDSREKKNIPAGIQNYTAANDPAMTGEIRIEKNKPPTPTRKLLQEWNLRKNSGDTVELSRRDFEMLTAALDDLDNRTSMLEKMPDGRMRIGNIAVGSPSVVLNEHADALSAFNAGDALGAYTHARKAVEALEAAESVQVESSPGSLSNREQAKIYRLAALASQSFSRSDDAIRFAEKAGRIEPSALHLGLTASVYSDAGRYSEAIDRVNRAILEDPASESWKNLKAMIETKAEAKSS